MTLGPLLAGAGGGARALADGVSLSVPRPGDAEGGGVGSGNGSGLMLTGPDDEGEVVLPPVGAGGERSGMKVLPSAGGLGGGSGTGTGVTSGAAGEVASGTMTGGGEDEIEGGVAFGFGVGTGVVGDGGGVVGLGTRFGVCAGLTGDGADSGGVCSFASGFKGFGEFADGSARNTGKAGAGGGLLGGFFCVGELGGIITGEGEGGGLVAFFGASVALVVIRMGFVERLACMSLSLFTCGENCGGFGGEPAFTVFSRSAGLAL